MNENRQWYKIKKDFNKTIKFFIVIILIVFKFIYQSFGRKVYFNRFLF